MNKEITTTIPFLGTYLVNGRPKVGQSVKLVADDRVYNIVSVYPAGEGKLGLVLQDHLNGITVDMEVNHD